MPEKSPKDFLLKAVEKFNRRLIIVTPDFKLLAVGHPDDRPLGGDEIGNHCYEVFHNRASPCENCAVQEVVNTGSPSLRPKTEDARNPDRMPCFYAYPLGEAGDAEAFVSMDFDLPTTGGIEEKLEQSKYFMRNLINSAVDGIVSADMKGKIIIFNEAASQIFGYTKKEALESLNIRDIYPDDLAYEVMAKLRDETNHAPGKLRSYQTDVKSRDGEIIPISLNGSIVYENGREVATIGFFHDLREMLQMQEDLKTTQIQLLQAEKMASLGKLSAGVAHQLNNPLGGITLFAKLIQEEYELEDGLKEDIGRILKDAERCRDTVKELLEFTRQTRQHMRPIDINRAILRTLFLLESQTLFHNIEIKKELSAAMPRVWADVQQMNHLFMNIVLNAAQAMEGQGELTLKSLLLSKKERIRIEITDTGPGIPKDILPNIFEPFYTTKDEGEGTGLGLSLAYSIVENHGGVIRAASQPGKGTTFQIDLPLTPKRNGRKKRDDENK